MPEFLAWAVEQESLGVCGLSEGSRRVCNTYGANSKAVRTRVSSATWIRAIVDLHSPGRSEIACEAVMLGRGPVPGVPMST